MSQTIQTCIQFQYLGSDLKLSVIDNSDDTYKTFTQIIQIQSSNKISQYKFKQNIKLTKNRKNVTFDDLLWPSL